MKVFLFGWNQKEKKRKRKKKNFGNTINISVMIKSFSSKKINCKTLKKKDY